MVFWLLALALAADGPAEKVSKEVQVEGRSFTVEVKGVRAYVWPRFAVLRGHSMDATGLKLARRAAEKASGCKAAEGRPTPTGLVVALECAAENNR